MTQAIPCWDIPAYEATEEELWQFFKWATIGGGGPYDYLATSWFDGLIAIEEGRRIEAGRQVWQGLPQGVTRG